MKTRDRIISLCIVGALIGGIWWAGSKFRPNANANADANADAHASASASVSVSVPVPVSASVSVSASVPPPPLSGACRAFLDASNKKLADAKSARACTPTFDTSMLACKTSPNGATWALRVDDVVELAGEPADCATGWLVRLVHVDVNGAESAVVPGISMTQRAHTIDVSSDLALASVMFFDFDGDGDDEVFVRSTRGAMDHPDEERAGVWTFSSAHVVTYAPASNLSIVGLRDIDSDGRPDLLVSFFGTNPVTKRFAAHSLAGGAFTIRDAAAVTWDEGQCPSDPKLDLAAKTPADFDSSVADDIACSILWGHNAKDLGPALAKACNAGGEAGTCPPWASRLVASKPPLSLK